MLHLKVHVTLVMADILASVTNPAWKGSWYTAVQTKCNRNTDFFHYSQLAPVAVVKLMTKSFHNM